MEILFAQAVTNQQRGENMNRPILQAIYTKYLGPTDYRGSRVKARCQERSITLDWDDSLNSEKNHMKAATELADSSGWLQRCELIGGALDKGYCFVLSERGE